MDNKIITDDILQKAIQDTIQTIADNIFEFESYSDESIAELFSLTPEEAKSLTELINDEIISKYKLWSSKKVSDELLNAQNECNDYTDDRLSGISSISLKYCEELPDVGESNCIYILKSTDSNPDTLNLYDSDNAIWISIGNFDISLDEYYKKLEIDTKLDLKADKTEILAQDDVITDTSLATTSNVLSATTTLNELDKKANDDEVVKKTDITTTIDSTSTDTQIPSAKAIFDRCIQGKRIDQSVIDTYGTEILKYPLGRWIISSDSIAEKFTDLPIKISGHIDITSISYNDDNNPWSNQYAYRVYSYVPYVGGNYVRKLESGSTAGVITNDTGWKRVCTTSVADVPITDITPEDSRISYSNISYQVKNGICYVSLWNISISEPAKNVKIYTALPHPINNTIAPILNANGDNTNLGCVFVAPNIPNTLVAHFTSAGIGGFASFSYPVSES